MKTYQRELQNSDKKKFEGEHRVNWQIRAIQVRVAKDDKQLGVMSTDEARRLASDEGLDLVELVPDSKPPVCRIMDYGRFKYEQNVKRKESAKRQRESQVQVKELRLRPVTTDHDTDIKISQAKKFLEDGIRVQFNLKFKGQREMCHRDKGFEVMQRILQGLESFSIVEKAPKLEGNRIICCLSPK